MWRPPVSRHRIGHPVPLSCLTKRCQVSGISTLFSSQISGLTGRYWVDKLEGGDYDTHNDACQEQGELTS
jgi:hypothetical protein